MAKLHFSSKRVTNFFIYLFNPAQRGYFFINYFINIENFKKLINIDRGRLLIGCTFAVLGLLGILGSCSKITADVEKKKQADQVCLANGGQMITGTLYADIFDGHPYPVPVTGCAPQKAN